MAKRRGGRPNRHDWNHATDFEIHRRSQTPKALLAGDRGKIALVTSTLSHLTYRHPRAYGKYEIVPPPPVACEF